MSLPFENSTGYERNCRNSAMAASVPEHLVGLRKKQVQESFVNFTDIKHRLEPVAKVQGIEFINDSKATNTNSSWYSLEISETPVIWIVGTTGKLEDYKSIADTVKRKVKAIVSMGLDPQVIREAFGNIIEIIIETASTEEAANAAYKLGQKGDVVLFSPACASFDLYSDYQERGSQFKKAVREL